MKLAVLSLLFATVFAYDFRFCGPNITQTDLFTLVDNTSPFGKITAWELFTFVHHKNKISTVMPYNPVFTDMFNNWDTDSNGWLSVSELPIILWDPCTPNFVVNVCGPYKNRLETFNDIDVGGSWTIVASELVSFFDRYGYDVTTSEAQTLIGLWEADGNLNTQYYDLFGINWIPDCLTCVSFPYDSYCSNLDINVFDTSYDGQISKTEFQTWVLAHYNASDDTIDCLFNSWDTDTDQSVDIEEYYDAFGDCFICDAFNYKQYCNLDEEDLEDLFELYDYDSNGYVNAAEFRHQNPLIIEDDIDCVIIQLDVDGDGQVNIGEWLTIFRNCW